MLHSLNHRELGFGLGDNGHKLIVGHIDGPLELGGVCGVWAFPQHRSPRFLRWRISPRWMRFLKRLAQMNLVPRSGYAVHDDLSCTLHGFARLLASRLTVG